MATRKKTVSGKKISKKPVKSGKDVRTRKDKSAKEKQRKTSKSPSGKKQTKGKAKVIMTKPAAKTVKPAKKKPAAAVKPKTEKKISKETTGQLLKKRDDYKKQLIKKRDEIIKEAKSEIKKYLTGENRQPVDTALDDGDLSVIDLSEDINFRRLGAHRESLIRIDEALRKINEGTFGVCEECGEKISLKRLAVMPFAIYCRDCQEKREEFEKLESEEL